MSQVRDQATAAITETRDSADREIAKVRADARGVAIDEAHKRVDEAFRTENVRSMLNAAARREVGPAIDRQVREEVDRAMVGFDQAMSNLEEIADLGVKMRLGVREALDGLVLKAKTAATAKDRLRAKNILESISRDYEKVTRDQIRMGNFTDARTYFFAIAGGGLKPDSPKALPAIIRVVRGSLDLNTVSAAFLALDEMTGHQFRMFDIDEVEEWCRDHDRDCKEAKAGH
jgi:hypothetical protein